MLKLTLEKPEKNGEKLIIPLMDTGVGYIKAESIKDYTYEKNWLDPRMHITIEMYGTPEEAREVYEFINSPHEYPVGPVYEQPDFGEPSLSHKLAVASLLAAASLLAMLAMLAT